LNEAFWALKENNFSPRLLYPAKLSFKIDVKICLPRLTTVKIIYDHQTTTTEDFEKNHTHRDENKHNYERMGNMKPQEKIGHVIKDFLK
jgi:hypothetical protein